MCTDRCMKGQILTAYRASVVFAIQTWLGESAEAKKAASQPAYLSVGMSCECHALLF